MFKFLSRFLLTREQKPGQELHSWRDFTVVMHPNWPFFDLDVRTPSITLQCIDDELGVELANLIMRGIHAPDVMPFASP